MLTPHQFDAQAREMVETQLRRRGINDERVLEAMRLVPRHEFVSGDLISVAYADRPLPIGEHETISQPYIVALVTQAAGAAPGNNTLEIGAGSGYQAAILAHLGATVCAVERNPQLAAEARDRLARLGFGAIEIIADDGSEGWPARAPYDIIIVSAATPRVSPPLQNQLAEEGRLIAPVGTLSQQRLLRFTRHDGQITGQLSTRASSFRCAAKADGRSKQPHR